MTGGRISQSASVRCRLLQSSGRSLISRRFFANNLSATVPIVLLLITFASDFAYLSGNSDGGGVLADEVTTTPPEETWTTSSNENVGTGEAAPFAPINKPIEPEKYIDPAMIGVLVAMAVMFIIICVVLRLFSK
uniref:Transmembrane protein n=1 Tax=Anopheles merus TaxID=30066 RepID=A0A182UZW5_ANOME